MFEIDPIICRLNDERTIALCRGTITKEIFLRLINWEKDPLQIIAGKLTYLSKEILDTQKDQFIKNQIELIKRTGNINGTLIYDNFEKIKTVYPEPELQVLYNIAEEKIKKDNCQGCAKNRETAPLLESILKMPLSKERNIDSLAEVFKKFPYAIKKLKSEAFEVDASKIEIPKFFERKDISFLPNDEIITSESIMPAISTMPENPQGMVRNSCIDCVRGHLFNAYLLFTEVLKGYEPEKGFEHKGMAIAHLYQAEEESLKEFPELTKKIRALRLKMSGQTKYVKETL